MMTCASLHDWLKVKIIVYSPYFSNFLLLRACQDICLLPQAHLSDRHFIIPLPPRQIWRVLALTLESSVTQVLNLPLPTDKFLNLLKPQLPYL